MNLSFKEWPQVLFIVSISIVSCFQSYRIMLLNEQASEHKRELNLLSIRMLKVEHEVIK